MYLEVFICFPMLAERVTYLGLPRRGSARSVSGNGAKAYIALVGGEFVEYTSPMNDKFTRFLQSGSARVIFGASVVALWVPGGRSDATAPTPATLPTSAPAPAKMQTLFSFAEPMSVSQWLPTDDRVMGGISRSRMRFDAAGHGVFEGVMSLEQNGGFASVRAEVGAPSLPSATHYLVQVRGDGKRYKLNLRMRGRFSEVSYQATFLTVANEWVTQSIPITQFEPTFRGRLVRNAPPLEAALVWQLGLMIADGQDGAFQLAIRRIALEAR